MTHWCWIRRIRYDWSSWEKGSVSGCLTGVGDSSRCPNIPACWPAPRPLHLHLNPRFVPAHAGRSLPGEQQTRCAPCVTCCRNRSDIRVPGALGSQPCRWMPSQQRPSSDGECLLGGGGRGTAPCVSGLLTWSSIPHFLSSFILFRPFPALRLLPVVPAKAQAPLFSYLLPAVRSLDDGAVVCHLTTFQRIPLSSIARPGQLLSRPRPLLSTGSG